MEFVCCRVLQVAKLDGVSRRGILAVRKLKSLEEFHFTAYHEEAPVMRQCLKLLPHLHKLFLSTLYDFDPPYSLQLRELHINNIYDVSEHIEMPELKVLDLCAPLKMHRLFAGGFPKLSKLYLEETDQDDLLQVLGHIGQQLQTLSFTTTYDGMQLRLDSVLDACPNVSDLYVCSDSSEIRLSQLQQDTLKQLQNVRLAFWAGEKFLPSGLLLQMLRLSP
jgi:hypothetical protein